VARISALNAAINPKMGSMPTGFKLSNILLS
jgi:hypothetical protein